MEESSVDEIVFEMVTVWEKYKDTNCIFDWNIFKSAKHLKVCTAVVFYFEIIII